MNVAVSYIADTLTICKLAAADKDQHESDDYRVSVLGVPPVHFVSQRKRLTYVTGVGDRQSSADDLYSPISAILRKDTA